MSQGIPRKHRGLGWHPGPVDERDYPLRASLERAGVARTSGSQFWYAPLPRLDQGSESSCTGFSSTNMVNCSPHIHHYTQNDAVEVYYSARRDYDEWEGEDYDGTSVRAALKAQKARGTITSYAFTQDPHEAALWILNRGPIVIGIDWYEGMDYALRERDYFIAPEGEVSGGHAICVEGARYLNRGGSGDYVRLLNSWGLSYGYLGRAKMTFSNFAKVLSEEYAVAATAVEIF